MLKSYIVLLLKKLIHKKKATTEIYLSHLKAIGMDIGEDVMIYSPIHTTIDEQYPWMIKIGNHVRITEGVKILTHDYSWSVLKLLDVSNCTGCILGSSGKVRICDNVFIGMNTIILGGVEIGENTVVGAGSIVTKSCAPNSVYAGNPARKIMSIHEYYQKRVKQQLYEAKELAVEYEKRYHRVPPIDIFHEYFMLFSDVDDIPDSFIDKMKLCENYESSVKFMHTNKPSFKNYDEFLNFCFGKDDGRNYDGKH